MEVQAGLSSETQVCSVPEVGQEEAVAVAKGQSAPTLPGDLAQAQARIAELEAENTKLREALFPQDPGHGDGHGQQATNRQEAQTLIAGTGDGHDSNQAEQLARANEDLVHFAYSVSHDLRAPLRTVTSFAQLLALKHKQKLDAQGKEFIRLIVEASTRMDTMLSDLLDFARVAGAEVEFRHEFALKSALDSALESLQSVVEETKAVVTHNSLPALMANKGQVEQLFQNLISNSLKYRRPETTPEIKVTAERAEGEWLITLRDNGQGFEQRNAERIFGVFQRLHGKDFAGTGIGLAICKRIVERHGGRIWAAGKLGEGATFSFTIPDANKRLQARRALGWQQMHSTRPERQGVQAFPLDLAGHFGELFKTLDLAQAIVRKLDGTILIWTKGAERLFGWSEAEALGKQLHELLGSELPLQQAALQMLLLREGEWSGEIKAHKRDGSVVWLAAHKALYLDGGGRPQSVVEVFNDITALKEAQAALVRSGEQRDLALEAAQMGIWHWDTRTGRVEWSETLEALLGLAPGSFEGTFAAVQRLIHPDDRAALQERIDAAFQNGPEYTIENRMLHASGKYLRVRGQGRVVLDEHKQPIGLVGVVWDNSKRKQHEEDQQFLLDLGTKLAESLDSGKLANIAVTEIAKYLGISKCVFTEIDVASDRQTHLAAYQTAGPPLPRTRTLREFKRIVADLEREQYIAISDVRADERTAAASETTYIPIGLRAFMGVPWHRDGRWVASITACHIEPRVWEEREITLLREVAARLWPVLENARLMEETRERQERFEGTFEQAAVGLSHVDFQGRFLRVNSRLCEITGYSREELLDGRIRDVTHPDDVANDTRLLDELKRGVRKSYTVEKRDLHKSGGFIWVKVTVSLVRDSTGEPKYAIAVIEDITERRKTTLQLEESNALAALRLREIEQIYAQAPVGLLFLDKELRYVRINEYMAQRNHIPLAEHLGRTVAEVLPPLAPQVEPILRRVIETREPIVEAEVATPSLGEPGEETIWLVSYFPFEAPDGTILGLNGVVQDVTEARRAVLREQELLKESERKFRELAETLPELMWEANAEGKNVYNNPQFYTYTGMAGGSKPDHDWLPVMHPDDAGSLFLTWKESVERGQPFEFELRLRRHDGIFHWFLNRAQPVRDGQGQIIKWLGTAIDIDQQKSTEIALRRSNEDLEQFAYAASHDLQEPLRTVAIYTTLLARKYGTDGEAQRFANYIVNGTTRMQSLLKGILEYSRVTDSAETPEVCNSDAVLHAALSNLSEAIKESGADVSHDALPVVGCQETHLLQMFQNLIGNAFKYRAQRPPKVHVSVSREGSWHRFGIADNGIGIEAQYGTQIFGMFKRLHRDQYPGVGAGLAICKRIVERYGGRISCQSEPGEGSTFYFTLPVVSEHGRV